MGFWDFTMPKTVEHLTDTAKKIKNFLVENNVPLDAINIKRDGRKLILVLPSKKAEKVKFVYEADADRLSFWYRLYFMIDDKEKPEERFITFDDALKIILTYYTTTPTTTDLKCKLVDQKLDKLLNIISNTRQKINPCTI